MGRRRLKFPSLAGTWSSHDPVVVTGRIRNHVATRSKHWSRDKATGTEENSGLGNSRSSPCSKIPTVLLFSFLSFSPPFFLSPHESAKFFDTFFFLSLSLQESSRLSQLKGCSKASPEPGKFQIVCEFWKNRSGSQMCCLRVSEAVMCFLSHWQDRPLSVPNALSECAIFRLRYTRWRYILVYVTQQRRRRRRRRRRRGIKELKVAFQIFRHYVIIIYSLP